MSKMTLSQELEWRGFINQTTYDDISELDNNTTSFYFGVDPSADSMTIGNLASAMANKVLIKHGYKAFLLVGGATGMIGDPDGKKQERDLKTLETIEQNKQAIAAQYKIIFEGQDFEIVDNYDWFKDITYLNFLRDIGKHLSMTQMLDREFVQSRIGEGGAGISYAEFSYSLIQGYDFLHLYREHGVTLQVCGADQWGNSLAGVEMIRKIEGGKAHVFSFPLIVNKTTGVKFGKSESGAVWLDAEKTSVFDFYQFWLNVDDEGVGEYLKVYTTIAPAEFDELMSKFNENPHERAAQHYLAYEVTKIVHGETRADRAKRITNVLFSGGEYSKLHTEDVEELKKQLPFTSSRGLIEALVDSELASSKSEARRFISQGAVSVNGQKITNPEEISLTENGSSLLQRGKNKFAIVE